MIRFLLAVGSLGLSVTGLVTVALATAPDDSEPTAGLPGVLLVALGAALALIYMRLDND